MADKRKSFTNNPALGFISAAAQDAPNTHDAPITPNALDTQHTQQDHDTPVIGEPSRGKATRRQKHARINMAFSDANIEYLRKISRLKGVSQTEYVNMLIDADREKNHSVIEQLAALLGE